MTNQLQNQIARMILRSRFSPQARWNEHLSVFFPLLKPAFPEKPWGMLLTMRVLDAGVMKRPDLYAKRLEKLRPLCHEGGAPEKALYHVLLALYHQMTGNQPKMARCMRIANSFGHDLALPHVELGDYYLYTCHLYGKALASYDEAVNCIYKYPLTDQNRLFVAARYANMAHALLMMHRPDEADDMLRKAEAASDTAEYLHASAMRHALHGNGDEAQKLLSALKDKHAAHYTFANANVPLILSGTHSHFTVNMPDEAAVRAYWADFLKEEKTLLHLLDTVDGHACHAHHHKFFGHLVPEPAEVDVIRIMFKRVDGQPEMMLNPCHSRTYEALVDMMLATCPDELRQRWKIYRDDR